MELFAQLLKVSGTLKGSPTQIAGEYARLATGPGKLSPGDFMRLRLFDKDFYGEAALREFIGDDRMRDICFTVNYRHDWLGVLSDKVASTSYLEAYGLPTIPIKAIYAPKLAFDHSTLLSTKTALKDFLLKPEAYPLFGKPVEGQNSLGSVALTGCDAVKGEVILGGDIRANVDQLIDEIDAAYSAGYLFQQWIKPHPTVGKLSKGRLATVRFITITAEDGVQIFRACLKIPAGGNVADNYWRSGNLLAQLDMETGRIIRVTSGTGLDMREHTVHPDTNEPLVGFTYPQWREMKALALNGARLMHRMSLIGWDIACTDQGPLIVEMNECPDSFISQFADRRGLLDETLQKLIAFQDRERSAFNTKMKARFDHN